MYSLQKIMSKRFDRVVKTEQQLLQNNYTQQPFLIKRDNENKKIFQKKGQWTMKQNAKYLVFLLQNASFMSNNSHSQLWELYKKMASFIKTRNYRQCKSHHQKYCIRFQTIPDIIQKIINTQPQIQKEIPKQRQIYQQIKQKDNQLKIIQEKNKKYENDQRPTDIFYDQQQNASDQRYEKKICYQSLEPIPAVIINSNGTQSMMQNMQKPSPEDWLQCHSLFLQYVSKMNQLRMRSSI